MSGLSQIFIVWSSAMKDIAMPASVESSAARGVIFLIHSPTKAPAPSQMPLTRQLTTPTFHARSAFFVCRYTGAMIRVK